MSTPSVRPGRHRVRRPWLVVGMVAVIATVAGALVATLPALAAPPVGPAPRLSVASGPAGTFGRAFQPEACPRVPTGYDGYVATQVRNAAGQDVSSNPNAPTDRQGNWTQYSPSGSPYKWADFTTQTAMTTGFTDATPPQDPPPGRYSVVVLCQRVPARGGTPVTVKTYAPVPFQVTGSSPTVRLSTTTVRRGTSFTVTPNAGCRVVNRTFGGPGMKATLVPYFAGKVSYVPGPFAAVTNGTWGPVTYPVPADTEPGRYGVAVTCGSYEEVGQNYRLQEIRVTDEKGTVPPPVVTPPPPVVTPPRTTNWVSLGDSYSSGEGTGGYDAMTDVRGQNLCHRSGDAWPRLMGVPEGWHLACSGATTDNLQTVGGNDKSATSQLARLREIEAGLAKRGQHVDAVTLSIGGNDIGFGELIAQCFFQVECLTAFEKTQDATFKAHEDLLVRTLDKVKAAAPPQARIVLVGYPRLFPVLRRDNTCGWLDELEQPRANTVATLLDVAGRKAAKRAGVTYVPTLNTLGGHEHCTKDSWVSPINPARYGRDQQQGHPRVEWQRAVAAEVKKALRP